MYLHCHKCGWSQDDFWDKDGYHPFCKSGGNWEFWTSLLFTDTMPMDSEFFLDNPSVHPAGYNSEGRPLITGTQLLALELERRARSVSNMRWKTYEEWKNTPKEERVCPKCGSTEDWDID